jgi:putative transposase
MHDWMSLAHVKWDCKYHVVFVPKYRKKVLFGKLRRHVGEMLKGLCRQRGVELLEGHLMTDHVHMCLRVPPRMSIAFVIGFLKGKSAVLIHRRLMGQRRMTGLHFWARGYCVSTVGLDEAVVREYIKEQEAREMKQLELDLE